MMRRLAGAAVALVLAGCGSRGGSDDAGSWEPPPGPDALDGFYYNPWEVVPASELGAPRGWQLVRGIIHLHSVFSHDACDDEPFVDGARNEECYRELRDALCDTMQQFAFLTDHSSTFAEHEYPDVLLHEPGDALIERDGLPVANRMRCDWGDVVIAAGTESGTMPIGLERHVADTVEERYAIYDDETSVDAYRDVGALAFVQHTEEWDVEALEALPLDGIEIYNLHWNMIVAIDVAVIMVIDLNDRPWQVPVPELGFVPLFRESEPDMTRWSTLLMGRRQVGILASDIHRNVFAGTSPDGERLDSYRRLMHWFSNYVLVPEGEVDDAVLKEAIGRGRLYGGFDAFGYPVGFDFRAEAGAVYEMGDEVPAGESAVLHVTIPTVHGLADDGPRPVVRARILRANDGEWDEVAEGETDLEYAAGPGVYRAEVRIVPEHLRLWLGMLADDYLASEKVWVYSNPIYVGVSY
jgi:hypothetical protein